MRDEPTHGFRRSGLWITMKVLLQLGLTIAFNSASQGKYIYKLIMLKFMSAMCGHFSEYSETLLTCDTIDRVVEILAKTARRVDKLTDIPDDCVDKSAINNLAIDVKDETIECIEKIRKMLDLDHKKMQGSVKQSTNLSTVGQLKFEEHINHNVLELNEYVKERKIFHEPKTEKCEEDDTSSGQEFEFFDPNAAPDIQKIKSLDIENEWLQFLNDVENWVLSCLDESEVQLEYLRSLATRYSDKAHHFYKNDPIGYSRMVLTMLKIIQVSYFARHLISGRVSNDDKLFRLSKGTGQGCM